MKLTSVLIPSLTLSLGLMMVLLIAPLGARAATLTALETVANVTAGTNDQGATTTATIANVAEVKATRTLTVNAVPLGNPETITIGSCVVTFGTVTQDINCADNAAAISTSTDATAAAIASRLRSLTGVTDTTGGHGALTITGTTTTAIFTTTNTEASSTPITFTDNTGGDVTSTASTSGVVPVAQRNTITIGGTAELGDIFTATLPTVGAVNYTSLSTDTTTTLIATGLGLAIVNSSGYASQAFTISTSTNTIVFNAKVAGTGFTQTSATTNRAAVAQTVTFTPAAIENADFNITINGTLYSVRMSAGATVKEVVEVFAPIVDANAAVACTEDDLKVSCSASSAGTAFTYSSNVTNVAAVTTSSSSGSSGGSKKKKTETKTTTTVSVPTKVTQTTVTTSSTVTFTTDLTVGVTGLEVKALQAYLNAKGFTVAVSGPGSKGNETMMFGGLTRAALAKFQAAKGIMPSVGYFGPKTRAYINANP